MTMLMTVLRSGGEYRPEHVAVLKRQLAVHAHGIELVCLSDVKTEATTIPLRHEWRGWWAKMELFRPDLGGDWLYSDLDTLIVGDIAPILKVNRTTVLRDFYWDRSADKGPTSIGSGLMFLTATDRARVWERWWDRRTPESWMQEAGTLGDQYVIGKVLGEDADRWHKAAPGKVCSYKAHIRDAGLSAPPEGVAIVCFHGKPRPWACNDAWVRDAIHGHGERAIA